MNKTYNILLVEDTEEVRVAVSELLIMNGYDCATAVNGKEGLELAGTYEPDVIISDVMMPEMDGIEFARSISESPELSHIPVIMLTAKVEEQDMIEGLESGAVDYLTKPFNSRELMLKIRNIINRRERYKASNWQALMADSLEKESDNEDKLFLKSLHDHISRNLDNANFGVSELAHTMMMSERNLYRKVKELTGQPVASLVREVRLQFAHKLIINKQVKTLSEAAYKVGFKSPKHFSRTYRQRYPAN